jgi:rubrerythrin
MDSSRTVAVEAATIQVHGMTRESFLLRSTLAAGTAYGALSATPYITRALAQSGASDVDIVNYALTLEYLESTFYSEGLKQVKGLSSDDTKLAKQIRDDEDAHVDALIATVKKLGGKPAAKPTFDFGGAFASSTAFLKTANVLEDTGVSAYNGAATLIKSVDVLAAAGSIVQIEARHAALIRLTRGKSPAPLAFDKASEMASVLKAVKPFIKA